MTVVWRGTRLGLGLASAPLVALIAAIVFARVPMNELPAGVICFGGGAIVPLASLAIAARERVSRGVDVAIFATGLLLLGTAALLAHRLPYSPLLVSTALVSLSLVIGTNIGRRIQHPGHLLPACVVVASADMVSVFSPHGASHAIAANEQALALLAISFPVPGTDQWAPALGIGDLVFVAIVYGAAVVHHLPYARVFALCAVGAILAGLASAILETAIPALVPIAAALLVGLPQARAVPLRDRRVATISMLIAVSLAGAVIATR